MTPSDRLKPMQDPEPLYSKIEADDLRRREVTRAGDRRKRDLLLRHIAPCRRLLDMGCGWGQLLGLLQDRVAEPWGADECTHRARDIRKACPKAKVVICRGQRLALSDEAFDAVITSQMLHEVKLFGHAGELARTLQEIRRVLVADGRYLLLDHLDAGDGDVVVRLPRGQLATLEAFEVKFRFRPARHEPVAGGAIRMSRRNLQDFLTKDWALDSAMESIEMNETHSVFSRQETTEQVAAAGLTVREWIPFADIREDLERRGGVLVEGEPWFRKFLMVARKT
jgi:ubiquinone/menaquinone biosynthesis C-methylase UbiE